MRTEHLREFFAAASTKNFTLAAKQLYMSQPKMSMHIAAMEEELGFKLFYRESTLSLTREGELFYAKVKSLLDKYDAVVAECQKLSKMPGKRLVFGEFQLVDLFPPQSLMRFSEVINKLIEDDPLFEIVNKPLDNTLTIAEHLKQGICDVTFRSVCLEAAIPEVIEVGDGTSVFPLEMDPMVVLVRKEHPLSKHKNVTPQDIAQFPVVLSSLPSMLTWNSTRIDFFTIHGATPTYHTHVVNTPSELVRPKLSQEVFLVAEEFSKSRKIVSNSDYVVLPITETHAQSCFCLCFLAGAENPVIDDVVQLLKDN